MKNKSTTKKKVSLLDIAQLVKPLPKKAVLTKRELARLYEAPPAVYATLGQMQSFNREYAADGIELIKWLAARVYLSQDWTQLSQRQRDRIHCFMQDFKALLKRLGTDGDSLRDLLIPRKDVYYLKKDE
jgi:hypothetical protein